MAFLTFRWEYLQRADDAYLPGHSLADASDSRVELAAWSRPTFNYQNMTYISSGAPLFTISILMRGLISGTRRTHSWTISRTRLPRQMAHRLFCLSLASQFFDYSSDLWASLPRILQTGTWRGGGLQRWGPLTAASCLVQRRDPCRLFPQRPSTLLRWVRGHYPQAWQRYGFVDSFNPLMGWL